MVEFGSMCPAGYIAEVSADGRIQRGAATCGSAGGDCQLFLRQLMYVIVTTIPVVLQQRRRVGAYTAA